MVWFFIVSGILAGIALIGTAVLNERARRARNAQYLADLRGPFKRPSTVRPPRMSDAEANAKDLEVVGSDMGVVMRDLERSLAQSVMLPRDGQIAELLAPELQNVSITAVTAPRGPDNDNDNAEQERRRRQREQDDAASSALMDLAVAQAVSSAVDAVVDTSSSYSSPDTYSAPDTSSSSDFSGGGGDFGGGGSSGDW